MTLPVLRSEDAPRDGVPPGDLRPDVEGETEAPAQSVREALARASRADWLCGSGIAVSYAYGYSVLPFVGFLLVHPLLHLFLTGSISALVTGGAFARVGRMSLLVVVPAGLVGAMAFDPFFWWAGHRWGEPLLRVIRANSGKGRLIARGERWTRDYGGWVLVAVQFLPVPNVLVYLMVGSSGMTLRRFLVTDAIGWLLWIGVLVGLGYAIGQPAVHVVTEISHYALWIALGIFALIAVASARSARRLAST